MAEEIPKHNESESDFLIPLSSEEHQLLLTAQKQYMSETAENKLKIVQAYEVGLAEGKFTGKENLLKHFLAWVKSEKGTTTES